MLYPYQIALGVLAIAFLVLLVRFIRAQQVIQHQSRDLTLYEDRVAVMERDAFDTHQLRDFFRLPHIEFEPMEAPEDGWVQLNIGGPSARNNDWHGEAAKIVLRMEDGTESTYGKKLVAILHRCTEL